MQMMQTAPAPIGPEGSSRIPLIDSIRALALLGVIVMNVSAMQMRFVGREIFADAGPIDIAAMLLDLLLVQGKARACFAFLFGFGFAMLMMRSEGRGDFGRLYLRRMLFLLAFGLINQVFLWWGDILVLYALLGMALLPLRNLTERTVLRAGLLLVILPPVVIGALEAAMGRLPSLVAVDSAQETARGLAAMTSPNYLDFVRLSFTQAVERRLTDTPHMIIYDLAVFGLFLLGSWAARQRIVHDLETWRPRLRRIALICLPVGLALSAVSASRLAGVTAEGPLYGLVTAASAGLPILAFGYLAVATLAFSKGWRNFQRLLAPAGRMPLTNYIASGAIGCAFFYGYGLNMLGKLGIAATNLLAISIFIGLLIFGHAWLARYPLGPLEWIWRLLTYGRKTRPAQQAVTANA